MLIITANLIEKGAKLDGLTFYENTIYDQVQKLITGTYDDPPAVLNPMVKDVFSRHGYQFDYSGRNENGQVIKPERTFS